MTELSSPLLDQARALHEVAHALGIEPGRDVTLAVLKEVWALQEKVICLERQNHDMAMDRASLLNQVALGRDQREELLRELDRVAQILKPTRWDKVS